MSLTIGSRSNTNTVKIGRATVETDALTGWVKMGGVGGGNYYQVVDPQALVDALAELFPDVKPSPPKPKVGDLVRSDETTGTVLAIDDDALWVKLSTNQRRIWRMGHTTVIERGES